MFVLSRFEMHRARLESIRIDLAIGGRFPDRSQPRQPGRAFARLGTTPAPLSYRARPRIHPATAIKTPRQPLLPPAEVLLEPKKPKPPWN